MKKNSRRKIDEALGKGIAEKDNEKMKELSGRIKHWRRMG